MAMSMAASPSRYWFRCHIGMEVTFAVTVVVNVEVHRGKTGLSRRFQEQTTAFYIHGPVNTGLTPRMAYDHDCVTKQAEFQFSRMNPQRRGGG